MEKFKMIHETVLKDILNIFSDIKNSDLVKNADKAGSFKSISSATENLTLVFPVFVSRNMNIENAAMIAKATERKCVSMLQMLFSAMSVTNAKNGIDYIRKFHTNMKLNDNLTVDDFIDVADSIANECCNLSISEQALFDRYKEDLRRCNFVLPTSVSENSVLDYQYKFNNYSKDYELVNEAEGDFDYKYKNKESYYDDGNMNTMPDYNKARFDFDYDKTMHQNQKDKYKFNYQVHRDEENDKAREKDRRMREKQYQQTRADKLADIERQQKNADREYDLKVRKDDLSARQFNARLSADKINYLKNQLLDNDVKKSNELVPTTMIVNFISSEGEQPIEAQVVIGVKCKLYPLDSNDIIRHLVSKHRDKNMLLKFIRATTREISFVRDFLLCIDKAKLDALSQSKKGSSSDTWKLLERRALKSRIKRGLKQVNDATAISTIVITQEEVEFAKKTEGVDLSKVKVLRPIMESLNFMCVCIVDETAEVAKFLYDTGDGVFEEMPFRSLEREDKNNDYKKIINLMTRVR